MVQFFKNEEEVAAYAKEVYKSKFKTEYEAKHKGKFLAVDVRGRKGLSGGNTGKCTEAGGQNQSHRPVPRHTNINPRKTQIDTDIENTDSHGLVGAPCQLSAVSCPTGQVLRRSARNGLAGPS